MADNSQMLVYAAAYENADAALADMDAVGQLHKDKMIGKFDAAVIDQQDGKPHIVKRMDRSRMRAIPEMFGGGTLPRKELHEAAEQLTANQAGLITVGEPAIEQGIDKALTKAAKVVQRTITPASLLARLEASGDSATRVPAWPGIMPTSSRLRLGPCQVAGRIAVRECAPDAAGKCFGRRLSLVVLLADPDVGCGPS